MFNHVANHMAGYIAGCQFSFVKGRSSQQQLLNKIHSDLENKMSDVVYLDFKKAFDLVDHNNLLSKLQSMGIISQLLNWFVASSYFEQSSFSLPLFHHLSCSR